MSWEPIGSQGLGNLCKGPLAALHPSSQVTEFTSLIIGGNRKVIGIECCHRINVSQLHINVSASLYYLCLRNTVASKCCLFTHGQESFSTAWPAPSLTQGSWNYLFQLWPVGSTHISSRPPHSWPQRWGGNVMGSRGDTNTPLCCPRGHRHLPLTCFGEVSTSGPGPWCWAATTSNPSVWPL